MSEHFSPQASYARNSWNRQLDAIEAQINARDLEIAQAKARAKHLDLDPEERVFRALEKRPVAAFKPRPAREYLPIRGEGAASYVSDKPDHRLEMKDDESVSDRLIDERRKHSIDALIEKLDQLDHKVAMRSQPRSEGVKNPGHSAWSDEREWYRKTNPSVAGIVNARQDQQNLDRKLQQSREEEYNARMEDPRLYRTTLDNQFKAQAAIERDYIKKETEDWAKVKELERPIDTAVMREDAYNAAQERALGRGRYPAQKPTYKDKLGRATLRGWDENLAKEDMSDDEALEIELKLRRMEVAVNARNESERREQRMIESRLAQEYSTDALQAKLETIDDIAPNKLAGRKYGYAGFDADSARAGRKTAQDLRLGFRKGTSFGEKIPRKGDRPAQKPFDPLSINRFLKERGLDEDRD